MSQYKIEAGTASHLGDQIKQQDCVGLYAGPKAPGYMMAVLADGAGSAADGVSAAEQMVRTARQNFETFSPLIETVEELLETIAREAHTLIQLNALATKKEPYSTMLVLVITPDRSAIWAHLGDTRLYRFRNGEFRERTNDDAHIEKAIQAVRAKNNQPPELRINVLGDPGQTSFLTISRYEDLQVGDAFLLCSDGLWRYAEEDLMGQLIAANPPRQAAEMLIQEARQKGEGTNAGNCTMAIVRLVPAPPVVKKYTATRL